MAQKLTIQQALFVTEYLIDLNGTRAAVAAGYSPKTAGEQAYDLLRRPHIARELAVRQEARLRRLQVRAEDVLEGLRRIAFFDPIDVFDANSQVLPMGEIPAEARTALAAGLAVKARPTSRSAIGWLR
jgi:phage terminase small subunit